MTTKPGRNDPCPCGSGKKYKKCCLLRDATPVTSLTWRKMRQTEGELVPVLLKHAEKYYGLSALEEAWDEYSLWGDVPLDAETELEFEACFVPWFVFNWIPDNAEVTAADHFPDMPIAKHYLEHQPARISSFQRRFIEETCAQSFSFYMVADVDAGSGMLLKDLLLNHEVYVVERQASSTLSRGSIVYARIVTMDDTAIMLGCAPTAIPPNYLHSFIDMREDFEARSQVLDRNFLLDYDLELREIYYEIRDELYNPSMPELLNTDGDPLQPTKLHYELNCTPSEALDRLATLAMVKHPDELTREAEYDEQADLVSVEFPWLKKGNKEHAAWDNTVLGQVIIDANKLTIEVNSEQRAEAIKRKITHRLGKRAVFRTAVIESLEKQFEEIADGSDNAQLASQRQQSEDFQALPEVQEMLRAHSTQHWKDWLDTNLPALQGKTPRQAAINAKGRERLEALFLEFEQRNQSAQPFSPDVSALRRALKMPSTQY